MFEREIEHISYDYFNVPTEDILKDHQPMGQLPICTDTGLNYFHCTKSFVGTYEELVTLITQRFNARAIMFKIRPESPEFKTLDEVKTKTYLALSYTMLMKGTNKKTAVLFNESQWIGKILFPQEEA